MAVSKKDSRLTIRLTSELKNDLEKLAEKNDRNLVDYIRVELIKIVRREKEGTK